MCHINGESLIWHTLEKVLQSFVYVFFKHGDGTQMYINHFNYQKIGRNGNRCFLKIKINENNSIITSVSIVNLFFSFDLSILPF